MIRTNYKNMNESVTLKAFTKTDWYAYAGAEELPSGKQPMIASTKLADVIVSGSGIGANVEVALEDESYMSYDMKERDAIELGKQLASKLDKAKDESEVISICRKSSLRNII